MLSWSLRRSSLIVPQIERGVRFLNEFESEERTDGADQ